tara:strand:+ start:219 stop:1361 length:1143 start_codon:yes stop_codon:yes gene_type:complete
MKNKLYTSLGLMSGTSMDGVDISLIKSDGYDEFFNILDEYHEYDDSLQEDLVNLRNAILNQEDLVKYSKELNNLERKITLFHADKIREFSSKYSDKIDLVGFHGQTIFHNPQKKISKQLGDGNLLSQLIKKRVVYDFRQEDIMNNGQGAPLTPIFHYLLSKHINKKYNIKFPICFMNIGGITNISIIKDTDKLEKDLLAYDIGPGNCLIDDWLRKNSNKKFDENGELAKSGKIDKLIFNQAIENFKITNYSQSLDIKDFDISFARGLTLENGCSTITNFTGHLIAKGIEYLNSKQIKINCLICGGGRKNKSLVESIKKNITYKKNIIFDYVEKYELNGDFIESQTFGYLAIRSYLNLPISFPNTTGCTKPTVGGKVVENF